MVGSPLSGYQRTSQKALGSSFWVKVYQFLSAPFSGRWIPTMLLGTKAAYILVLQG